MKKILIIITLVLSFNTKINAVEMLDEPQVRGVNPADNITKIEILPKSNILNNKLGVSINTLTLKYDLAIKGIYGLNIEIPFARFEGFGTAYNGLSDTLIRGRVQNKFGNFVSIIGAELAIPTATEEALGSGKWQTNPVLGLVYAFSPKVFLAGVAKQHFSVGGRSNRDDINTTLFRLLGAYVSQNGWWLLMDPQVWLDNKKDLTQFLGEVEFGTMTSRTTGIWIRFGHSLAGDKELKGDWSVGLGVRFISF